MKKEPYKKVYENGILMNPITKDNPYLMPQSQRPFNRKKKRYVLNVLHETFKHLPKFILQRKSNRGKWLNI